MAKKTQEKEKLDGEDTVEAKKEKQTVIKDVIKDSVKDPVKETKVKEKETGEEEIAVLVEAPLSEEEIVKKIETKTFDTAAWQPKTALGKAVKEGKIVDINQILDQGQKILEPEIVDVLLPTLESDLLLIGQSKGKFGGGQRRAFRQTQKKTKEGNKPGFATFAIIGDHRGHIGAGFGKSRETVPAREKAFRKAKLQIMKIRRGCGSWQCNCKDAHSIPFKVEGKCGSVKIRLMPAPKGTGLCAGGEIAKILKLAGIEDVWSKSWGKTPSRVNTTIATMNALRQLMLTKIKPEHVEAINIQE